MENTNIEIGPEVKAERIGRGAKIHPGCRVRGADTFICSGAEIGREAPATVENCCIGPEVSLKGGYFKSSVFLKKASVGSCAHIREGTIMEEQSSAAHSAGLKQTILFPFVTLGSLINFCDCLMAGGTGKKNHSEVGSSYIHFNFTPQQDKATPSLIGDVAKGVMLNQDPVFLGGQGGLVGPCRLAYGTVTAAGTINRKDELRPGRLIYGGPGREGSIPYRPGLRIRNAGKIVANNLYYIASLHALRHWYLNVRRLFISESMPEPLFYGLVSTLEESIRERARRLDEFAEKQAITSGHRSAPDKMAPGVEPEEDAGKREKFLEHLETQIARCGSHDYTGTIQSLDPKYALLGSSWLQQIIDSLIRSWQPLFDLPEGGN